MPDGYPFETEGVTADIAADRFSWLDRHSGDRDVGADSRLSAPALDATVSAVVSRKGNMVVPNRMFGAPDDSAQASDTLFRRRDHLIMTFINGGRSRRSPVAPQLIEISTSVLEDWFFGAIECHKINTGVF